MSLKIDPFLTPVLQPVLVKYTQREKWKEELDRLEKLGVIRKVDILGKLSELLVFKTGTETSSLIDRQLVNSSEYFFSNSVIIHKVIIQPRDANFVTCIWFETPVKHRNDALFMSFI